MKVYCLGFAIHPDKERVLLIRKAHPAWQAGFFNGVGGTVEDKEASVQAMIREAIEEANLSTNWTLYSVMKGNYTDAVGAFLCAVYYALPTDAEVLDVCSKTDEQVEWLRIDDLSPFNKDVPCITNVPMLVHMALCHICEPNLGLTTLHYEKLPE